MCTDCENGKSEQMLQYRGKEHLPQTILPSAHTFYLDCKEKLSTFASDTSRTVGNPQRKNNCNQVLDILNRKFNLFRNGIGKDSPDEAVGNVVKRTLHVDTFLDFINSTDRPAIVTPLCHSTKQSTTHLTHSQVRTFIETSFNLAKFNLGRGDRVAICLPEGPVLDLCLLSTMAYCTCVPSNCKLTADELLNDYKHLKVKAVIVPNAKLMTAEPDPLMIRFRLAGLQLIGLKTMSEADIKFILVQDPITIGSSGNDSTESPTLNQANELLN